MVSCYRYCLVLWMCLYQIAGHPKYENWMSELPKDFLKTSLTEIAIPGSHDSASYSLNKTEDLAPEVPNELLKILSISKHVEGGEMFLKDMVYRWSLTQRYNITQQLELGIRYLDLRIVYKKERGKIYTFHGLLGTTLEDILNQVSTFTSTHKKELVILDINHMLNMDSEAVNVLNSILENKLQQQMCLYNESLKLTLENIWETGKNVIVLYKNFSVNNNASRPFPDFVWHHTKLVSPFRQDRFYNTQTWLNYLDDGYKHRNSEVFFVSQGILQPHWMGIAMASLTHTGTLETWVSDDATKCLVRWLQTCKNGPHGVNIVIADFVEKYNFVDAVLKVNNNTSGEISGLS